MKNRLSILFTSVFCAALPGMVSGQIYYSDNFDSLAGSPVTATASGTYGGYAVNMASTDNRVIFGYDYSLASLGIPSAPHSTGGTQIGVRFDANIALGVISSLAISPTTTFSGNYSLTFDMWLNTIGPFPGGGTGSSENMTAGVGYNGASFQNATSGSGVWFSGTGDGGFSGTSTTPDYGARVGTTFQTPGSGVYAAGTATGAVGSSVDNANVYYTSRFAGQASPAPQSPASTAPDGSLAWKWHTAQIDRIGTTVTWYIDGNLIATVNNAAATATDNLSIGYWDATASKDAGNVFGLIDNVTVSAPEPTVGTFGLLGGLAWLFGRRRRK